MQKILDKMKTRAHKLLESAAVDAVLAWKSGDLSYDNAPAFFKDTGSLNCLVYDGFCSSNLSKYLVEKSKTGEKTLVFLKPCDTYSLNQLLGEHRVSRENVYVIGIGCSGGLDIEKIRDKGIRGITQVAPLQDSEVLNISTIYGEKSCIRQEVLLEKCLSCKGKEHKIFDELLGEDLSVETAQGDKFSQVTEIEEKTSDERFDFWRGLLSKCIRCNSCRNICPACTCVQCVFDNAGSGVAAKVNATEFEENMFHIIRAFHVAGRCSDCGECSRACLQGIPIHLLNRKFIKDMNNFYGDFQAGETAELSSPLLCYDFGDVEPNVISERKGD